MNRELLEERKKNIYSMICDEQYRPMKLKEMAILLQVPREQREELKEVLETLILEGKVEVTSHGKYKKGEPIFVTGTFVGNMRGFGFVVVEGEKEDYFIPETEVGGAFHGDTVQIEIRRSGDPSKGKRREARVVKVLERGIKEVIGTFEQSKNFGFVVPDNQKLTSDIFIPKEHCKGAMTGHKVIAQIVDYGNGKNKNPEGRITEILGHITDPGVDILSIVRAYGIPEEFPVKVMNQAERVPEEIQAADMAGRKDLRDVLMITIDGEDAKDLDDAVSLTRTEGGYLLGVHIADVTNYVQEKSALDVEALERGTSVYLADRVIPMLPRRLSNGICSLNQGVDRLALSCIMEINEKGAVVGHEICESVIRVDRRMSYTQVAKILADKDEAEREAVMDVVPMLEDMAEAAALLRKKREARGSVNFDFPESKIILNPDGTVADIHPYERNLATDLIEDFMLAANETVAEDYFWQELPFVYRIHGAPDPEKIKSLSLFLGNFGLGMKGIQGDVHPKELQKLLKRIEGTPEENLIARLVLRSMRQAKYSEVCEGHFGLSAQYYCHFTSPIRRYPDLQIHRIIKDTLRGRMNENRIEHYKRILASVAEESSRKERRADEAEREVDKLKKAQYMSDRIGEVFEGVISGVMSYGYYVELPNTVEGMVSVNALDGFYRYDEKQSMLIAERGSKCYKIGQRVKVRVAGTNMMLRTVDFEPEE